MIELEELLSGLNNINLVSRNVIDIAVASDAALRGKAGFTIANHPICQTMPPC